NGFTKLAVMSPGHVDSVVLDDIFHFLIDLEALTARFGFVNHRMLNRFLFSPDGHHRWCPSVLARDTFNRFLTRALMLLAGDNNFDVAGSADVVRISDV